MAEIRVEEKRGGAGRWLIPLLLLLAIAAAAYWYFGMRDGSATRDAVSDTAITQPADTGALRPSDTAATSTTGATATSPSTP
jgi:hypothetical protein